MGNRYLRGTSLHLLGTPYYSEDFNFILFTRIAPKKGYRLKVKPKSLHKKA